MGRPRARRGPDGRLRGLAATLALAGLAAASGGCAPSSAEGTPPPTEVGPPSSEATGQPLRGALAGLEVEDPTGDSLDRLRDAAEDAASIPARPRDPLEITDTDDDFVGDAQRAWTLALAHHIDGDPRHGEAAADIVDAWSTTTRSLEGACPDTGACSTSLMVSRAAPGLVQAVDLLRADGAYDEARVEHFHSWLREVILPAASDRDNNWGDAGTYLRAMVGATLEDRDEMEGAAERWRARLDLLEDDGRIPEEVRRGDAGLLYSQEALDYKVAAADVLARKGIDLWEVEGARGGTLRAAVDLVAEVMEDPAAWPAAVEDLRVPTPNGLWPVVLDRWPDGGYDDLAREAGRHDDDGHSAITWTALTHPVTG